MRHGSTLLLAVWLVVVSAPQARAQDEATRAAILSRACNSCHGPAGYSPGAIPPINNLPVDTFVRAMREFKDGKRPSTIMGRMAKGYTDEEIVAMARYFSAGTDQR